MAIKLERFVLHETSDLYFNTGIPNRRHRVAVDGKMMSVETATDKIAKDMSYLFQCLVSYDSAHSTIKLPQ